jgi:hypothetical protein
MLTNVEIFIAHIQPQTPELNLSLILRIKGSKE